VATASSDTDTSFGTLLRRYRIEAELSQEALAERAHMSARGVSDLERGVRSKPYRDTVEQLANALRLREAERSALVSAAQRVRVEPPAPARREQAPEANALLTTKLTIPPARRQFLARPRLLQRIEVGLRGPLILLAAPAGSGKTTLLSAWFAGSIPTDRRVGWVSLDARDSDPVRFWRYVLAALESAGVDVGADRVDLRPSPPSSIEVVLTHLLNALSAQPDDVILILDDYHAIDNEAIHRGMAFFLEHLPPRVHLVISTRTDPLLPLARLRASNRITEVRVDDLRFGREEAAAFLIDIIGLELAPAEIEALEIRTEGWIAGLQLAAASLEGRPATAASDFITSFTGSHRHVIDYLTEEVLARMPESVQHFLLHTSILDRFSAPLCAFVMHAETTVEGVAASRELLEELERSNLFLVPLDEQREWYRYHQLFAEAVRHRLRQREPDCLPQAHLRASSWFEEQGFLQDATEHALSGGAFERAAGLIERVRPALMEESANQTLWQLLNRLPDEIMAQHPLLSVVKAWYLLIKGQLAEGERWLDTAEAAAQREMPGERAGDLRGEISAARGFAASFQGDTEEVMRWVEEALRELHPDNLLTRGLARLALGRAYMTQCEAVHAVGNFAEAASLVRRLGNAQIALRAMLGEAQMERAQGHLSRAIAVCEQAIAWSAQRGHPSPYVGMLHLIRADVLRERNELDMAMGAAQEALHLWSLVGYELDTDAHVFSLFVLARIEQAKGHLDAAMERVRRAQTLGATTESRLPQAALQAYEAQLWLAQENVPAARDCLDQTLLDHYHEQLRFDLDLFILGYEQVSIIPAQVLIAQGRAGDDPAPLHEALTLLQADIDKAGATPLAWLQIKRKALQSLAHAGLGDGERARECLEEALVLGRPEGYVRVFADEGAPLAALLRAIPVAGTMRDYVATLLSAIHPTQ
jgi:LuxR family maltose regulon positive regulatory protein